MNVWAQSRCGSLFALTFPITFTMRPPSRRGCVSTELIDLSILLRFNFSKWRNWKTDQAELELNLKGHPIPRTSPECFWCRGNSRRRTKEKNPQSGRARQATTDEMDYRRACSTEPRKFYLICHNPCSNFADHFRRVVREVLKINGKRWMRCLALGRTIKIKHKFKFPR